MQGPILRGPAMSAVADTFPTTMPCGMGPRFRGAKDAIDILAIVYNITIYDKGTISPWETPPARDCGTKSALLEIEKQGACDRGPQSPGKAQCAQ